jgi:hypothetical protein
VDATVASDQTIYCIAGPGICAMSVCAPNDTPRETIERWANTFAPTGISSRWAISEDDFAAGQSNPCQCEREPDARLHYLLNC